MKRLLSLTIVITLTVTSLASMGALAGTHFPDMEDDHWAMAAVTRLMSEGTIQGFTDGTFKPTGVVSRGEFVKMLGKSDVKFDKDFADVGPDHWAYEYVMYSQLEGDANGNFNPGGTITRGEVASLLYKRYAKGAKSIAPNYIVGQGTDPNAVAWVYNTGLMVGGDMLNLRLTDTLTRAEAAVLIVRAKDLVPTAERSFIDNFSDDVYKAVYEGSGLFDTPYEAAGNITYEELSVAALRFQYKYKNPAVRYNFEKLYDEDYAKHWSIISTYALDEKGVKATKEEGAKLVTTEDAIAILTLGAKNNEFIDSSSIKADGTTYPEISIKDASSNYADKLSYAYNFGISLYAGGKINARNIITKRELSCILFQYSLSFGSHIGYHCGYNAEYLPLTTRLDIGSYPHNSAYYPVIASEIPNYVYEAAYTYDGKADYEPSVFVNSASMSALMFTTPLMYIASAAYDKGADVYIDFFPALTTGLGTKGDVMRVRVSIVKTFEGMKLSDVFTLEEGVSDRALGAGDVFWCDLNTNQRSATTLYLDYNMVTLAKVIE